MVNVNAETLVDMLLEWEQKTQLTTQTCPSAKTNCDAWSWPHWSSVITLLRRNCCVRRARHAPSQHRQTRTRKHNAACAHPDASRTSDRCAVTASTVQA